MKRKMRIAELMKKPHYKSIINLTFHYTKKGKALRQLHYRYALIANHDNIENTDLLQKMKKFFANDLEKLYTDGKIIKNCITSRKNLNNFLNKLCSPKRNILEKRSIDNEDNKFYLISGSFNGVINHDALISSLDNYPPETVHLMSSSDDSILLSVSADKKNYLTTIFGYLLGVPWDFLDKCNEIEKKDYDNICETLYYYIGCLSVLIKSKYKNIENIGLFLESSLDADNDHKK
ncbi:MAG: hypothetical protein BV457_09255 [Thermoplasmata archaeon M9B1D]|nr:MAG: hypothetical protein BV457_09255 [Thermoplasmata archaeon M9B1D]PNX46081.1 MAG: hypothetical protein BV456_12735 [Thermoplasmata archaeon M8B2D]